MELAETAQNVLKRLLEHGYSAYVVGGCVRDTLLGRTPGDWDICTSALPEEVEQCFSEYRIVETGLKHGTVTVFMQGELVEITTFRRDGEYFNHRSPRQVAFVGSLQEDLKRRDFTVNAMAADLNGKLIDLFDGQVDLAKRVIRCVGDPDQRFQEDALRILRAMRFASKLDFSIEPKTAAAMERNKALLREISGERIYRELTEMLIGTGVSAVLNQFGTVLQVVLPEIKPAVGFLQRSPYHNRDVWGHTIEAVGHSAPDPLVRWALLLHDLGKPACFTLDAAGVGHFYGHPIYSEELTKNIFTRLHVDKATMEKVGKLVRHHDEDGLPNRKTVRRWINRYGSDLLFQLLEVKRADCLAHVKTQRSVARYNAVIEFTKLARQVLEEEQCFSVRDLAVNGKDVLAMGVHPGPQVGDLLERLLDDVLEERCCNERKALLQRMHEILESEKGRNHAD